MTTSLATPTADSPRWLQYWAILTVVAALPLLLLGAEVTTKQVGMVDPDWPTYPWQLWLQDWRPYGLGFLIEHGHRLFGYLVGICVIVLNIGLFWTRTRRWLRVLGLAALIGVCIQGLLGGLRVKLNAWIGPETALVHGVFAQVVFALLVSLAVCTGPRWGQAAEAPANPVGMRRLRRGSLVLVGLLFLQILLGAWVRRDFAGWNQRGHFLMAFVVVAWAAWLVREAFALPGKERSLSVAASCLGGLIVLQLGLGVESWLIKFQNLYGVRQARTPAVLMQQDLTRSAHFLIGSLVFAAALTLTLQVYRRRALTVTVSVESAPRLEGAA